jgi:hypothetical protein
MVVIVPQLTGYAGVLHVAVSVARVACLIDGVKYMEPADVKPPEDDTERRRLRARGPTLRSLVRLAIARENARELDRLLTR